MRPTVEPESLDVPAAHEIADLLTLHTCLRKCYGKSQMAGSCCTVGERNYIIGPIPDADALLERLSAKFDRSFAYDEVFISFDEGKSLFPDRPCWQEASSYPALRPKLEEDQRPCAFLGDDNLCTIHDIRSVTCARYVCGHLKDLLDAL